MKNYNKIIVYSIITTIWICLWWIIFLQEKIYAISLSHTNITLGINNSYSWFINLQNGQNIVNISWDQRIDTTNIWITIWATTWSFYSITWGITTISWYGSWNYSHNHIINLSGEWINTIYGSFFKNIEPYTTNTSIMVDTTPPNQSQIIYPTNNIVISGNTLLSRSTSNDSGIWLSHYRVHLSLNAWFLWEVIIISTWNSIELWTNNLPIWTIFRYIESIDYLGNSSTSNPGFFHYGTYSIIEDNNNSYWWWWWWWNITPIIQNNSINTTSTWTITSNIIWNNSGENIWESNTLIPIEEQIYIINQEKIIPIITNVQKDNIIANNNITNSSNQDNNVLISNNIYHPSAIWIKEYLLMSYNKLFNTNKQWNLLLPIQNQNIIVDTLSIPKYKIYNNLLKKQYFKENTVWSQIITYITELKNPIYYIIQTVEYWLNIIEKIYHYVRNINY